MRKFPLIAIAIAALLIGYWLLSATSDGSLVRYTTREVPLSFAYDESAYVVTETPPRVTLMLKEDYESLQSGERAGGEGPPAIVIERFDNPNNPGPIEWAKQYPQLSNYNLKIGEASERTVSGWEGIEYFADGLYPNKNVVFADESRIFYVNGSYLDSSSRLYRDFDAIVDSIQVQ